MNTHRSTPWSATDPPRADLLRRAGRSDEAKAAYEDALTLAPTEAERRYLAGRLREL